MDPIFLIQSDKKNYPAQYLLNLNNQLNFIRNFLHVIMSRVFVNISTFLFKHYDYQGIY